MPRFSKKVKRISQQVQQSISRGKTSRRARVGRTVLLVCAALLLVIPVVLLAHPISYVPLISAVLLVVLSWGYLQVLRRSLDVAVEQMADSCERGRSVPLTVTLSSTCPLPFPRIELEFFITDLFGGLDDVRTLTCALKSRETAELVFDVSFAHLGTYSAGVRRIVVHDLLGLFSAEFADGVQRPVVVRPREVNLGEAAAMKTIPDESRSALQPVAADDVDYASVREYRYGDSLKTIHWNLSARNADGTMFTRLFEAYVNPSLAIVIDPCSLDYDSDELMSLFDGMVEVAAGLSRQAHLAGMEAEILYVRQDGSEARTRLVTSTDADDLVSDMMHIKSEEKAKGNALAAEDMLRAAGLQTHGFGNAALITSRPDAGLIAALSEVAMRRRNAMAFVAVPRQLEGKDRERLLAPLHQLDATGAVYHVVESNELMTEVCGL